MTPTARIFRELIDIVSRAYDIDTDRITAAPDRASPVIREARALVCFVAHDVLRLSQRQIGILMQRDHKAVTHALAKVRMLTRQSPVFRRVLEQVTQRLRERIRHFDTFEPSEAAQ